VFADDAIVDLRRERRNNARMLIEDCMIGANESPRVSWPRAGAEPPRIVRSPERWDRIEKIAADHGDRLPPDPDARALEEVPRPPAQAVPCVFPIFRWTSSRPWARVNTSWNLRVSAPSATSAWRSRTTPTAPPESPLPGPDRARLLKST
jgi:hypothetical protein